MGEKTKVIVVVLGGMVQEAYSDNKNVTVLVCDWDVAAIDEDAKKYCNILAKDIKKLIPVL